MTGHALADATSLALHREVASRLRAEPSLVGRARERVAGWGDGAHPYYRDAWTALLDGPLDALCALLESDSERARELRQASPFAGIVDSATRWRIWRSVRGQ
jgi:hypothetical protein